MFRKLCFTLTLLTLPMAGWGNISLSPFFIELDAASRDRRGEVRFVNTSNTPQTYNITMVNFKQDSNGKYIPIDSPVPGNPFAAPYLEWSPHQVTLQPNQSQIVRVQRRPMATATSGEYVSHLLVQEQAPETVADTARGGDGISINLTPLYGMSIPVMIENGDLYADARIESARVLDQGQGPIARVKVSRDGTRSFYGTLIVKDGGKEYGRVEKFRIFMTTPDRIIDIPLTSTPPRGATVILQDENTNETLETMRI